MCGRHGTAQALHDLNHSQGTTFLIVTHDPAVARQTHRVIVMADGQIAREDVIGSPLEEDLKMWRHSGLGRRIVQGEIETLNKLGIDEEQSHALPSYSTIPTAARAAGSFAG
jgi:ABC-type dipeptide/oligopeptide/nickel transport system ATPase component